MAVAKVLRLPRITRSRQTGVGGQRLVGSIWILENPYESMQTHCEMCYPYRLDHCENNGAFDHIPRRVLSMGLVRANVEIGEVSSAGF